MSRQFDAKQEALKAYPNDQEAGARLLLDYLDVSEKDFIYEEGMTPAEYVYGPAHTNETCICGVPGCSKITPNEAGGAAVTNGDC